MPRGIRVKTCEGAAALQAERGPERGRWRRGTHLPVLCAHWPSLSPRPVLHCGQHPKNPAVQWSCSLLHSGLSLQHVGQWSCSLSRRGFPCSTWVSGPVLCRAGAFPAARGSGSTPSLEHQPPSLLTFSSRLQGPLSPGFLGPIWLLLLPFLPTSKRWWASEVGPQTASLSRSEVLIFLVP